MGQNIENTVNIKVTADTSQAVQELQSFVNSVDSTNKELASMYDNEVITDDTTIKRFVDNISEQVDNLNKIKDNVPTDLFNNLYAQISDSFDSLDTVFNDSISSGMINNADALDALAEKMKSFISVSNEFVENKNEVDNALANNIDANNIDELTNKFKLIEDDIENGLNKGLNITSDEIDNIKNRLNDFIDINLVNEEQIEAFNNKLNDSISKLKQMEEALLSYKSCKIEGDNNKAELEAQQLAEEAKQLEFLRSMFHGRNSTQSEEEINAIKKEEEERQKLIAAVDKQFEAFVKLQEEYDKLASENMNDFNNSFVGHSEFNFDFDELNENVNTLGDNANNTSVDLNSMLSIISGLAKGGKLSVGTFEKLASAIGMSGAELTAIGGAAGIAIAAFKLLNDNLKEIINGFVNIGKTIGEGAIDGIDWFIDSLKNLSDILETTIYKLQEFSEYGIEIQNNYIGLGNFIGTDALEGLNKYADTLERTIGLDATGVINDIETMASAISHLGAKKEQIEGISKSLYQFALDLHGYDPTITVDKAASELNSSLIRGKIVMSGGQASTKALIKILGQDGVEAFNKLNTAQERYNFLMKQSILIQGAYQKYLETDAGKIEILNQQYSSLLGNIGQIALHLYAMVAPVLTQILQLANGVISALMKLFNIDVKVSTGVGGSGGLGGLKDSLDEITESAGKANKQLASFDDVIQINDNKSGGLADVGDLGGLEDFGGLLGDLIDDSNELTDIWGKFKRLIEDGDWLNAGKEFIKVLAEQLNKIQWGDIKENAAGAGKSIADLINGLFNIDLNGFIAWNTIGTTIAEGLNTAISFVDSTLSNISFVEIGKSLGNAWQALWNNLDTDGAAHSLYEAFTGIFEFAIGWLSGGGISKVATSFSEFIDSLFSNFTEDDLDNIVYVAEGIIDDIINTLSITADALTSDKVKKVVFSLITKLVNAFKDNASDWGSLLNDIAMDVLNFIEEGIDTADNAGIQQAFTDFIYNLNLGEILSSYLHIKWTLWTEKFRIWITTMFSAIGGFIWEAFVKLLQLNIAFSMLIAVWIYELGKTIWNGLNNIGEDIANIFSGIWNFICDIFNPETWANLAKNAINALWNGIKSVWNSTISNWSIDIPGVEKLGWEGINISIPKLATGGIATRSILANIGEAGAEAVLPLENNTAWMDKLATKIANQTNSNGNGGRIVVELSDKPLITRAEKYEFAALIVDSLKAYGVNIAIV